MSIQLIDDARNWWRMASVQISIIWGVAMGTLASLPTETQALVFGFFGFKGPETVAVLAYGSAVIAAATVALRLWRQSALHSDPKLHPPEDAGVK